MIFLATPAHAEADGKITIIRPERDRSKTVVIKNNGNRLIIRTDEDGARRLNKILKKNGRIIIRDRGGVRAFPDDYYPYYRDKGTAYSVGRALGTKLAD